MVVQVGSDTRCSTVAIARSESLLKPMEDPVQAIALMNASPMLFGTFCFETLFKAVDCIVSLLRTKELIDAALNLLVWAYVASKIPVGVGENLSNTRKTFTNLLLQAADVRFASHIDTSLSQDSNLKNGVLSNDEMDRSCDQCKASIDDMLLQGPVQRPDRLWEGGIFEWIISAARGKDEVNSNHSKTDKTFVSGKKDNNIQDDDEEEDDDDDDVEDEGESGDEENDDGEEGEEDGNEDDDDDDDDDDEEEEEEDDEDDEEVAPISVPGNIAVQIDEEDDDSDEGEEEEEGVEDEDDFGEEGEDEDGEEDEEDEENEDDEDAPEPPRKKNKSS